MHGHMHTILKAIYLVKPWLTSGH